MFSINSLRSVNKTYYDLNDIQTYDVNTVSQRGQLKGIWVGTGAYVISLWEIICIHNWYNTWTWCGLNVDPINRKTKITLMPTVFVYEELITSFYRTFGCPIICTDTYSQCYCVH